jgi:hypothetical protein
MPFGFLKRRKPEAPAPVEAAPSPAEPAGAAFVGLTEEWRLAGRMDVKGRLLDALNRREPLAIHDVMWGPPDGSVPLEPAPGLRSVDPYDLILVIAGEGSLPPLTEEERVALRIHKVPYDVALEIPPYRVVGTIHLYPGTEPGRVLEWAQEMFVPVTDATAYTGDEPLRDAARDVVLVNRSYLRGVEQVDRTTGEPYARMPGEAGYTGNERMTLSAESPLGEPSQESGQRPSDAPAAATGDAGPDGNAMGEATAGEARPD